MTRKFAFLIVFLVTLASLSNGQYVAGPGYGYVNPYGEGYVVAPAAVAPVGTLVTRPGSGLLSLLSNVL